MLALAQEGAETTQSAETEQAAPNETFVAPVVIDGETLFVVRGASVLPADKRAEKIQERIIAIAESSDTPTVEMEIEQVEFGYEIRIDGRMATVTTAADAELEKMELEVIAELQADAIEKAVILHRTSRSHDARIESAIWAVAWSVAFLILSFSFFRWRKKVVKAAGKWTEAQFTQVEAATGALVRGAAVASLVRFGTHVFLWLTYLMTIYYYLSFVLLSFAETRPIAELLLNHVSEPIFNIIRGFISYLPNLITLVIIYIITRYCVNAMKIFFENVEVGTFPIKDFEPHWVAPTFFLLRILTYVIALVFAYPYIPGSDSAAFQGLTILAGVMVSLGSNTVVSNMMAGLFVIYRRSTNVGDRIQVGDQFGDVVEIKLMETVIKSVKNELISIPNSQLLNSEVKNFSRKIDGRGMLIHTTVGIGYEEPPAKVEAMLIEAAHRTQGLKKSPEPFVLWQALADYAINYEINAYTNRGGSFPKIRSDLHKNIVHVFNENGTQIMTPSYESDPETPKIPDQPWDGVLAHEREAPKT